VLCTRKISALNEKCTSGMLPFLLGLRDFVLRDFVLRDLLLRDLLLRDVEVGKRLT
jgi:hypothetical protein